MMMALQRRNPGAFSQGNVNLLRKGAVLAIPGMDAIREMTPREASEAFREQTRQWKAMRAGARRGASTAGVKAVPETAPPAGGAKVQSPEMPPDQREDRQPDAAGDAVVPQVVDELPPEEKQLRVIEAKQDWPAGEDAGPGADIPGNERLKRAIASSEDDLKAVKEINRDLDELRAVLEMKIETLRKSLEEKNRAIENLQRKLERPAVAEEPAGDGSGGESILVPDRKATPADVVTEVEPSGAREMVPPQMGKEALTKPEIWLKQYWMHLALAGVSILLVLTLIALGRAKRREALYAEADTMFPDSYVELDDTPVLDEEVDTSQVPSQPPADDVEDALDEPRDLRVDADAGEDDFLREPGTDISGALSEADVYLAYHRYGRAESIIKDAIEANPDSMMLKAKLLEIYAFRKDKKQFTSFMEHVYESTDDGSPELWARIVEMGRDLIPDHPLIAHADSMGDAGGDGQTAKAGLSTDELELNIPSEEQILAEVKNATSSRGKIRNIELHDLDAILEDEGKTRKD
jgi:pilus assembly protein FimV